MRGLRDLKFIIWQRMEKISLLQSNEFWDTYEEQIQNCRETWLGNEEELNSCIAQVHVDLDIEN